MSVHSGFAWGQGLNVIDTLKANKDLLDQLDGTTDGQINFETIKKFDFNGALKSSAKDGETPMSLADAAKFFNENQEFQKFLVDRWGTNDQSTSFGDDHLGNAKYELSYRTTAWSAATQDFKNVDTFENANIWSGRQGGEKDIAISDFINHYKSLNAPGGDLTTTNSNPMFAMFDKAAFGGNKDGKLSDDELKAAILNVDSNADGTIAKDEMKQWMDFANSPMGKAIV